MVNIRTKGQRAERELCAMFNEAFGLDCVRNLMQTMVGGDDLTSVPHFSVECKNHEKPAVATWYAQAHKSSQRGSKIPVVCWKVKRKGWKILIALEHIPPGTLSGPQLEQASSRIYNNLVWLTWEQFKTVYHWYEAN